MCVGATTHDLREPTASSARITAFVRFKKVSRVSSNRKETLTLSEGTKCHVWTPKLVLREAARLLSRRPSERVTMEPVGGVNLALLGALKDLGKGDAFELLFVIGPWGSGKSTEIDRAIESLGLGRTTRKVHFFGESSPRSAQVRLVTALPRLAAGLILVTLLTVIAGVARECASAMIVRGPNWIPQLIEWVNVVPGVPVWSLAYSVLAFALLTNRLQLFYIAGAMVQGLFGRRRIIVLEDLERSSLGEKDQWALINGLWRHGLSYVVPIGFDSLELKANLIGRILKANGRWVELPSRGETNLGLATAFDRRFPFQDASEWLSHFSAREVISLAEHSSVEKGNEPALVLRGWIRYLLAREGLPINIWSGGLRIGKNPVKNSASLGLSVDGPKPVVSRVAGQIFRSFDSNECSLLAKVEPDHLQSFFFGTEDHPAITKTLQAIAQLRGPGA